MLTEEQYKEKWYNFLSRLENNNFENILFEIWEFQKSILTDEEIILVLNNKLILKKGDPRDWVLDESDKLFSRYIKDI
jgi:hypothetical protein